MNGVGQEIIGCFNDRSHYVFSTVLTESDKFVARINLWSLFHDDATIVKCVRMFNMLHISEVESISL